MTTSTSSATRPEVDLHAVFANLGLPAVAVPPVRQLILPTFGQTITSRPTGHTYKVGALIGEGHFSHVFKGADEFDDNVAIKVLKPRGTYEQDRLAAVGEVERLLTLRHKRITHVQDAFVYRDAFYIVTEECGITVDYYLGSGNNYAFKWVEGVARCVCSALEYIHLHEMVYLDLHPGNVFFYWGRDELNPNALTAATLKIGDLGITKPVADVTPAVTMANWMVPPEVLDPTFGPAGKAIDIYHCGLLLLQMAVGRRLRFTNDEILDGAPRRLALTLAEPHRSAIEKALRRHVEHRTPTARDLWLDIKGRRT